MIENTYHLKLKKIYSVDGDPFHCDGCSDNYHGDMVFFIQYEKDQYGSGDPKLYAKKCPDCFGLWVIDHPEYLRAIDQVLESQQIAPKEAASDW